MSRHCAFTEFTTEPINKIREIVDMTETIGTEEFQDMDLWILEKFKNRPHTRAINRRQLDADQCFQIMLDN